MSEQLTVAEIRNDLKAEVKLAADNDDMTPWQFRYIMHTQFLLSQLATEQIEVERLLESQVRHGKVIDKWRNRAVKNRADLATITEERNTLLASLKEVMEYPDCLTIEHKSSILDRAIKAIEEVEK